MGTLTATDPEGDPLTYSLDGVTWTDPETGLPTDVSAQFSLVYDPVGEVWQIFADNSMDYEDWYKPPAGDPDGGVEPAFIASITVSDTAGNSTTGDVTINLLDVAESPEALEFLPGEGTRAVDVEPVIIIGEPPGPGEVSGLGAPIFEVDEVVDRTSDPRVDGNLLYIGNLNQVGDDDVKTFFTQYIYSKQEYDEGDDVAPGAEPESNEIFVVDPTGEVYINLEVTDWDYEGTWGPGSGFVFVRSDAVDGDELEYGTYYLAAQVDDHYLFENPGLLPSNLPAGAVYLDDIDDGEHHYLVFNTFGFKIGDVNEAPEFLSGDDRPDIPIIDNDDTYHLGLPENNHPYQILGYTPAWDVEDDSLLYGFWDGAALTATSSDSLFIIDQASGVITANNVVFNYEDMAEVMLDYEIRVYDRDPVTDPEALFDEATVEIEIIDVNEAPEFADFFEILPIIPNDDSYAYNLNENEANPVTLDTIFAYDEDGTGPGGTWDTLDFGFYYGGGLHDTSRDGLFILVDTASRMAELRSNETFDYEDLPDGGHGTLNLATNTYEYVIGVSDGEYMDTAELDITITDVNEPPEFESHDGAPGTVLSNDFYEFVLAENNAVGATVPGSEAAINACDVDGSGLGGTADTLYYWFWDESTETTSADSGDGLFSIDQSSGEITANQIIDYESFGNPPPTLTYEIAVFDRDPSTDPEAEHDTATVNIEITDVEFDARAMVLRGVGGGDLAGFSISRADVNGDGITDVIIGAPGGDGMDVDYTVEGGYWHWGGAQADHSAVEVWGTRYDSKNTAVTVFQDGISGITYTTTEITIETDGYAYSDYIPQYPWLTTVIDGDQIENTGSWENYLTNTPGRKYTYQWVPDYFVTEGNPHVPFTPPVYETMDDLLAAGFDPEDAAPVSDPGSGGGNETDIDYTVEGYWYWGGSQADHLAIEVNGTEYGTWAINTNVTSNGNEVITTTTRTYTIEGYEYDHYLSTYPWLVEVTDNDGVQETGSWENFLTYDYPISAQYVPDFFVTQGNTFLAYDPPVYASLAEFLAAGWSIEDAVSVCSGENTSFNSGETYVIYGNEVWGGQVTSVDLEVLGKAGFEGYGFRVVNSAEYGDNDHAGWDVSHAGDVNGDLIDDFIIGAPRGDYLDSDNMQGAAYVVFGKEGGLDPIVDLALLDGGNGFKINGDEHNDLLGWSVMAAGDFNGDLIDDIILGAPGAEGDGGDFYGTAYIVWGVDTDEAGAPTPVWAGGSFDIDVAVASGDAFALTNNNAGDSKDHQGWSVGSIADLNEDGASEVLVAGHTDLHDGRNDGPGSVFVVLSDNDGSNYYETHDSANLVWLWNNDYAFRIYGNNFGDKFGYSVAGAGDFDGDGLEDIIVGAPDVGGAGDTHDIGSAYLIYGSAITPGGDLDVGTLNDGTADDGVKGFQIVGSGRQDVTGFTVNAAGDINGDGLDDILVGAPGGDNVDQPAGDNSGETYLIFGGNPHEEGTPEYEAWLADPAHAGHDGHTGGFADGTLNVDDLFVDNGGDGSDGVVIFGDSANDTSLPDDPTATQGYDVNSQSSGFDVSAAGDFDNDGYDDLMISAPSVVIIRSHEDAAEHGGIPDARGCESEDEGEVYVVFGNDTWGEQAEVHIEDLLTPLDVVIEV